MALMTHRERILAAVQHRPVDRIPTDLWATPEVLERLFQEFSVELRTDLYDHLEIDGIILIEAPYVGPELERSGASWKDFWGVTYSDQEYEGGHYPEFAEHPLAEAETIADLDDFPWPSTEWFDYSLLPVAAGSAGGRAVMCGYTAIFHIHNRLRGLELSLTDPILNPEFTHALLDRITDFYLAHHKLCFESAAEKIDLTEVTDDWGAQKGLISSPSIFREFYRPRMQKAVNLARSFGISVFHHDDGDIRPLLSDFQALGVDVLNPIQWRCGDWNLSALKEEFGDTFCFHGGVDNQQTLPFGTTSDVAEEVERLITTLASDQTGFILAPCHNLQPNTPTENIVAMYEAARRFGTFRSPGFFRRWFPSGL